METSYRRRKLFDDDDEEENQDGKPLTHLSTFRVRARTDHHRLLLATGNLPSVSARHAD